MESSQIRPNDLCANPRFRVLGVQLSIAEQAVDPFNLMLLGHVGRQMTTHPGQPKLSPQQQFTDRCEQSRAGESYGFPVAHCVPARATIEPSA